MSGSTGGEELGSQVESQPALLLHPWPYLEELVEVLRSLQAWLVPAVKYNGKATPVFQFHFQRKCVRLYFTT